MKLRTRVDFANAFGITRGMSESDMERICEKTLEVDKEIISAWDKRNQPGHGFEIEMGVLNSAYDSGLREKVYETIGKISGRDRIDFRHVVMCGIGGSELGATALINAAGRKDANYFPITSLNEESVSEILDRIEPEKTVLIKSTRSNTTMETLTAFDTFRKRLEDELGDKHVRHCIAVVGEDIADKVRDETGYHTVGIKPAMSGRFTAFHAANLMTMALMGVDVEEFHAGGRDMLEYCLNEENIARKAAAVKHWAGETGRKVWHTAVFSPKLVKYGDWVDQLTEESLGQNNEIGLCTKTTELSNKLHSDFQNWSDGEDIFLHHFVFPLNSNCKPIETGRVVEVDGKRYRETLGAVERAAYVGTATALANNGRPNYTTFLERIDAGAIGELMMRDMLSTVYLGEMNGLSRRADEKPGKAYFFQPGVEAYKKIMRAQLAKPEDFVRGAMTREE